LVTFASAFGDSGGGGGGATGGGGGSGGVIAEAGGGGSGATATAEGLAVVDVGAIAAGPGGVVATGAVIIGVVVVDDVCGAGVVPQATPSSVNEVKTTIVVKAWFRIFAVYLIGLPIVKRFVKVR